MNCSPPPPIRMSERIRNNLSLLEFLSTCSNSQLKSVIPTLSSEQLKVLTEVFLNLQFGLIPVPEDKLTYLQNKKTVIRTITSKSTSQSERKELFHKNSALICSVLKFSLKEIKQIITDVD